MASPDWEAIESAYRAGSLSIRSIADKHSVTEGGIRKRAKQNGWQRNLTDKVREATKTKLVRSEVRTTGTQKEVRTDEEIIEEAADEAASVVMAHREGLAAWRGITNKLRDFLEDAEITEDNHSSMARSITAGVDAQIKVIAAERKAYNLDTEEGNKSVDNISDLMDSLSQGA
ncbi:hypothetical protein ABEI05_05430 [Erwinia billingiae]|uniref:hypothetical protein n=1 Tax=Erwinia billingiae TaxID=182337 RepID=UPI00320945B3